MTAPLEDHIRMTMTTTVAEVPGLVRAQLRGSDQHQLPHDGS